MTKLETVLQFSKVVGGIIGLYLLWRILLKI